ncbi:MAG: hypothetical protein KDB08_04340 [Microthrixaceae bacterium]|nr:hypothetical protein [Microthrixaceae bacterium]
MVTPERAYARSLRWYPRAWRAEHGAALLGTMLDAAEAEGRDRPSAAERRSAAMHGLGMRLNERFAQRSAAAAVVIAVIGLFAFMSSFAGISQFVLALVPWFSALAVIALLRSNTPLPGPVAVAGVALTTLTFALGLTTLLAWSMGFDAADEGTAGTWFTRALLAWLGATWVIGTATIALLANGMLSATRMPAPARVGAALLGGAIAMPPLALMCITPLLQPILSVGLLALTLRSGTRPPTSTAPGWHRQRAAADAAPPASRRMARTLSWLACALALAGVTYALTGSTWVAGGPDGTQAMRVGIAVMLAAGAILLVGVAVGVRAGAPGPWRRSVPLALIAAGVACASVGTVLGSAGAPMSHPTSVAGAIAIPLGTAALLICGSRGTRAQRWIIGVAVGVALAPMMTFLLPAIAFTVPLVAAGYALVGTRRARPVPGRATLAAA